MTTDVTTDAVFMRRALELAARGRGAVEPNPMVGAVVVKDGVVVGEGWHQRYGGPHAEVHALDAVGPAARGATLYVTLEPCRHFGKTPPCTHRVLAAGVARVVAALRDPFPAVDGGGFAELEAAGVSTTVGVLEAEARALAAPYLRLVTTGRPFVHAKWAMTLDGRIATAVGESQWISGEASRRHAHQFRGTVDAIVVGIGTVVADDPLLTARPAGPRVAVRVVFDAFALLPPASQLVATARETPTVLATTAAAADSRVAVLERAGVEVWRLPADAAGRPLIAAFLDEAGRRRWTNVLVEGGPG
ncbi:MAG: bifunctional diaminohydroxyphosphoribosylaminopyrimidine deaminase/5-amino-6-(5-phosphoribosylamino)uracil reductase RibD, partial [Planctomycetia bacterium]